MRRLSPEQTGLAVWAWFAGLALWAPAVALPVWNLPLQSMDLVLLAGWPLIAVFARRLPPALLLVLSLGLASIALSWTAVGGSPLVLGWTLIFALPFVVLASLVAGDARAGPAFVSAFLTAAALSAVLFLAQIALGAETLDFRNNIAFRLPPHFGRGFALFPEVSTYAAHTVLALGVVLALALHSGSSPARRRRMALLAVLLIVALLFTRSTSVLVLVPAMVMLALAKTTRASLNTLIFAGLLAAALSILLTVFVQSFYVDRLASASAERSAAMRLASILGGLSPLARGEIFGVGIGENAEIRYRAYEAARAYGLSFGTLPKGVNSQVIGRAFEEGWPAVVQFALAVGVLLVGLRRAQGPVPTALICLAAGSLLTALSVIGYRGINTTWLWLALPAGILSRSARVRRAAPGPVHLPGLIPT